MWFKTKPFSPASILQYAPRNPYEGDDHQQQQARMRLLQAVQRGTPIYSVGVRLLIDGLELFADCADLRGEPDDEVKRALRQIRRYAAAMDWGQSLTEQRPESPCR
jgi:hypothetical protein